MKNKFLSIILIWIMTMLFFSSCGIINLENQNTNTEKDDTEEKEQVVEVTRIELDKTSMFLTEGETVRLQASVFPRRATDKDVQWESSNPKVASVQNGLVRAKECGIAYIYAFTSNGVEASCTVNVLTSENDAIDPENPQEPESPQEPETHTHTEMLLPAVAPTCTETGLTEGKQCSDCGEILIEQSIVDALGHDYITNEAKAPTCTEAGWDEYEACSRCDYTTYEEISALGHSYNENYVCTICGVTRPASQGLEFTLDTATDTYIVTGIGTCADTDIVIPCTYEEKAVTGIGNSAFEGCKKITKVSIQDNITTIGNRAFYECINLEAINIPTTVTVIEGYTFYCCKSLKSITLHESIEEINEYAFASCYELERINYNVISLASLSYSSVFNYAGEYSNGVVLNIGNKVEYIPSYMFSGNSYIEEIVFEESSACAEIRDSAFINCTKLSKISMPDSLARIGDNAFGYCNSLKNIEIPKNVTYIGADAFRSCNGLTSVTIGDGVTEIGDSAFKECYYLKEINYNATEMSDLDDNSNYVFSLCGKNIAGITLNVGNNVKRIPANLFYANYAEITNIKAVNFEAESVCESIGENAFAYTTLESVIIPDSVLTIGVDAFDNCECLTSITIGKGVKTIEKTAFYSCKALEEINFNATEMNDLATANGVFAYAGQEADGITLTIGKDVLAMPSNLFNPYTSTGAEPKLIDLVFEEGRTSIGYSMLDGYATLTSIIIPETVTDIGARAFYGCSSLTSVVIPKSVTNIGQFAFMGCSSIAIYCEAEAEPTTWDTFWNGSECPGYWYSENEPTEEGNYWHYVDGVVTIWM